MINNLKIDMKVPSIHYRKRTTKIKYIIIHCSAPTPQQQINILNQLELSTHYIVSKDGQITEVVSPTKVAYHAGVSHWYKTKTKSLNNQSIGIEIENETLGQQKGSYSDKCIRKLLILIKYLKNKYNVKDENILGHSDIAPTRKPDPGVAFPWQKLAQQKITLWYNISQSSNQKNEIKLLKTIGYDTTDLSATRYAFCRRFIPEEIIIEPNLQKLLDNPYPTNFIPKKYTNYIKILQAVAKAYQQARKKHY